MFFIGCYKVIDLLLLRMIIFLFVTFYYNKNKINGDLVFMKTRSSGCGSIILLLWIVDLTHTKNREKTREKNESKNIKAFTEH